MEYFVSAIWIAFEYFAIILFFKAFLSTKCSKIKTYIVYAFGWAIIFLCINIPIINPFSMYVKYATIFALLLFLFEGQLYAKIFLEIVIILFITGMDSIITYGSSVLLKISVSELIWKRNTYIAVGTLNKLIVLLCTWLIYHSRQSYGLGSIHRKWFILTLIFPMTSLIILSLNYYNNQSNQDISIGVLLISALLAVANMGVIYLIHSLEKATIQEQESALLRKQIELQKENYVALEGNYRIQRKAAHEFERHIQVLNELLMRNEIMTAQEYVGQLQKDRNLHMFSISTGHPAIDVILNQKYQTARAQGIKMQIQINELSSIKIHTDVLVVLLSNLLDNAIEACQKISSHSHREILCTILHEGSLYICVRNTSMPVKIENGQIATDKKRSNEHGYGMPAIRYVLNQLGAEYIFEYNDGWFQFVADVPM